MQAIIGTLCVASAAMASPAGAQGPCGHPHGNYIVVRVGSADPIGGLAIRSTPHANAPRIAIIPAAGSGIETSNCNASGWCHVRHRCDSGYSYAAKYLSPRRLNLVRVVGVSPSDPEGLNVRSGPGSNYPRVGSFPHNGSSISKHTCEAAGGGQWCLVSNDSLAGWVNGKHLAKMEAPEATPTGSVQPPPPNSAPKACELFPMLCSGAQ